MRTCVGCRQRAPKPDLLRVVVVEGACVPDLQGRLPGRGASLHPRAECLSLALRRRAFPRAFRVPGPLDVSALEAYLEAEQLQAEQARRAAQARKTDQPTGSGSNAMSAR